MVNKVSLSSDVEKLITEPEVLRVLRLFIRLGRTDLAEFLNATVNKDVEEVKKILEALRLFVKRGLRTQGYLTSQMRSGKDPSEWPYDPTEKESISSDEEHLVEKFGVQWPTVRGAIDKFSRGILYIIDRMEWKDSGLTYRAWTTVDIRPPDKRLWSRDSNTYKSQRPCACSRLHLVIFYPGLVNLAFLDRAQADVLVQAEARFHTRWELARHFRKKAVDITRSVVENYGSVNDGYTTFDGLLPKEELEEKRKVILADFDLQRDAMLGAGKDEFEEYSHAGWWHKNGPNGPFWSPANSIASILHSNKILVGKKFREHCNTANDNKRIRTQVARNAVRHYGFGYVPTVGLNSNLKMTNSAQVTPKSTGTRGKSPEKHKESPERRHRSRERQPTTTENHSHQKQRGSSSKAVVADTPAKNPSQSSKKPGTQAASADRSSTGRASSTGPSSTGRSSSSHRR
ncbi:hypothetical protein CJF32_00002014 [Rutstroemia sp. NJR-2017a WRK4]|nr:hypothetical protein CJF32_00002014 [Rutstroemia sp. NJR-2017a WRK4]